MHRCSDSIGLIAAALAKAQTELVNPERSQIAVVSAGAVNGERSFRYAPLSSGLEIVRKSLGKHEIATVQATGNRPASRAGPPDYASRPRVRRVDLIGLAGVLGP